MRERKIAYPLQHIGIALSYCFLPIRDRTRERFSLERRIARKNRPRLARQFGRRRSRGAALLRALFPRLRFTKARSDSANGLDRIPFALGFLRSLLLLRVGGHCLDSRGEPFLRECARARN